MGKTPELLEIDATFAGSLYSRTDLLKVLAEYLNDALPRVGYQEDHFWTNVRIVLCMACCGFGLYGQFGTKFPQDRMILGGCVVGYFLFSGILTIFDYFILKSSVICLKIKDSAVHVDLDMPPFDDALDERSGRRYVAALAEDGLEDHGGRLTGGRLLLEEAVEAA